MASSLDVHCKSTHTQCSKQRYIIPVCVTAGVLLLVWVALASKTNHHVLPSDVTKSLNSVPPEFSSLSRIVCSLRFVSGYGDQNELPLCDEVPVPWPHMCTIYFDGTIRDSIGLLISYAGTLQCVVRAFDPTYDIEQHKYPPLLRKYIAMYPIQLCDTNAFEEDNSDTRKESSSVQPRRRITLPTVLSLEGDAGFDIFRIHLSNSDTASAAIAQLYTSIGVSAFQTIQSFVISIVVDDLFTSETTKSALQGLRAAQFRLYYAVTVRSCAQGMIDGVLFGDTVGDSGSLLDGVIADPQARNCTLLLAFVNDAALPPPLSLRFPHSLP